MIIAETDRLLIRLVSPDDHEALTGVFGDAEVMRFGPGRQGPAWIHDWLGRVRQSYRQHGYGHWALIEKSSQTLIGYCGLVYKPDVNGRPEIEIGYRLAHAFWGRGYATEAVAVVRDYAFSVLGLTRLIAIIDPGNTASIRVAEKAGLRREGEVMFEGYDHPDDIYSIEQPRLASSD